MMMMFFILLPMVSDERVCGVCVVCVVCVCLYLMRVYVGKEPRVAIELTLVTYL